MESLSEAIAALVIAQANLVAATQALLEHNIDLESHADIREQLEKIMESETVFTREQVISIVNEILEPHIKAPISEAHDGWEEFEQGLTNQFTRIDQAIADINSRIDGLESPFSSDLEAAIQKIEDKYAVILNGLQDSFTAATEANNVVLAEEIKLQISKTLDDKRNEILVVMDYWQEHGELPPSETP